MVCQAVSFVETLEMETLLELVQLFQKTKFKSTGLRQLILEKGSLPEMLYEGIARGEIRTDQDVLNHFKDSVKGAGHPAALKNRLKDRLLDAVLLLDLRENAFTDRQKAFFECSRKMSSFIILMSKNARRSGVAMAEGLLRNTYRFEFTEITLEVLRNLSFHYSIIEGEEKRYQEIEQKLVEIEEIWAMERQCERLYLQLITGFVRKKGLKEQLREKAGEYTQIVKPFMERCHTYRVQLLGRLIEILWYDSMNDYQAVARLSQEALAFFEQKDYRSDTALQTFYYHLFVSYLNLQRFEECKALIVQYGDLYPEGSFNWFKLQEIFFLAAMHSLHYKQAQEVCDHVLAHSMYSEQPAITIELWKIFEAHIAFLERVGVLSPGAVPRQFRLKRFLNEVVVFAQDKGGMNIPVQIIQCLHYMADQDHEQCIDRVDNLAKYRQRYLKEDATFRSRYFMRLLEQIPKSGFDPGIVESRTGELLTALKSRPMESTNQNHEIEIIPYESLWEIVLKFLSQAN